MIDKMALCERIKSIYPDIGECGIDIKVDYDDEKQTTTVFLRRGNKEVKHYLPMKMLRHVCRGASALPWVWRSPSSGMNATCDG